MLANAKTKRWQCNFTMSRYVKPDIFIQMFILMFPCVVNGKFFTMENKDVYNYSSYYVSLLATYYTNQPTDMTLLHVISTSSLVNFILRLNDTNLFLGPIDYATLCYMCKCGYLSPWTIVLTWSHHTYSWDNRYNSYSKNMTQWHLQLDWLIAYMCPV